MNWHHKATGLFAVLAFAHVCSGASAAPVTPSALIFNAILQNSDNHPLMISAWCSNVEISASIGPDPQHMTEVVRNGPNVPMPIADWAASFVVPAHSYYLVKPYAAAACTGYEWPLS